MGLRPTQGDENRGESLLYDGIRRGTVEASAPPRKALSKNP